MTSSPRITSGGSSKLIPPVCSTRVGDEMHRGQGYYKVASPAKTGIYSREVVRSGLCSEKILWRLRSSK